MIRNLGPKGNDESHVFLIKNDNLEPSVMEKALVLSTALPL